MRHSAAGGRPPRILVVAYHFPPEGSIGTHRTLRLVRRLCEAGWDVTVLTGTEATYSAGCSIDRELLRRVPAGARVVRAPALRPVDGVSSLARRGGRPGPSGSSGAGSPGGGSLGAGSWKSEVGWLRRAKQRFDALCGIPDQHAGWLVPAVAAGLARSIGRRPDVVYSTAPPWTGQLVARSLAAMLGCRWVADFRDPWARAPWRDGWLPAARRAAGLFERTVVGRADAVVFTTRTNMDEYAGFYGAAAATKFHLVRNGCDRDELAGLAPSPGDGRFTLLHAGSLYGGRKPAVLLAALAALRDRGVIDGRSFCFRQVGRVALSGFDMPAERRRLGLEEMVSLAPSQPRRETLQDMLAASCLLLLQPGTTVSIPGKLFEYLAAGRPILALAEEGETSELVRASGRGVAVLPADQAGIERAIQAMVEGTMPMSEAVPLELFDGELRTRDLAGLLERMCRAPFVSCARSAEAQSEGDAR